MRTSTHNTSLSPNGQKFFNFLVERRIFEKATGFSKKDSRKKQIVGRLLKKAKGKSKLSVVFSRRRRENVNFLLPFEKGDGKKRISFRLFKKTTGKCKFPAAFSKRRLSFQKTGRIFEMTIY